MKQKQEIKLMAGSAVIQYLSTVMSATKSEILEGASRFYRFEPGVDSPDNDRERIRSQIGSELKEFVKERYVRKHGNGYFLAQKLPTALPTGDPYESWLRDLKETYPPSEMLPLINRHSGTTADGKQQIELYYFLSDGLPVSLNCVYMGSAQKVTPLQPEQKAAVPTAAPEKLFEKVPIRTLNPNGKTEPMVQAVPPAISQAKFPAKKKPAASVPVGEDEQLQERYLLKLCQKGGAFFEQFVAGLLVKQFLACGIDVTDYSIVGGNDDGGIDVIFHTVDEMGFRDRVMLQAKCHIRSIVTENTIRDFYGSMKMQDGTRGIFITTTGFTSSAQALLNTLGSCIGIDGATLYKMAKDLSYGILSGKSKCFLDPAIFGK